MPQKRIEGENYEQFVVRTAPGEALPVDIGGAIGGAGIEIRNDEGAPLSTTVPQRTPTTTRLVGSTSSQLMLAANANRRGFSISNISDSELYLSFANPATINNCFIEVPPGGFILLDQQLIIGNAIYGVWSASSGGAQVTEYV